MVLETASASFGDIATSTEGWIEVWCPGFFMTPLLDPLAAPLVWPLEYPFARALTNSLAVPSAVILDKGLRGR